MIVTYAEGINAQENFPIFREAASVAVIDQNRLFDQTNFGRAARDELQMRSRDLVAENSQIASDFEEEERLLAAERATLTPEEFRAKASDFDARVKESRAQQDAKLLELNNFLIEKQQQFFEAARPILLEILNENSIDVVLSRDSVLLAGEGVDITDLAIRVIDERLPKP